MTKSSPLPAVLLVLFGPITLPALTSGAELLGADIDWPTLPAAVNLQAVSLTAAGAWLLARARRSDHPLPVWCAAALTLAGIVLLPLVGQAADTAATVLVAGAGASLCAQIGRDAGAPLWRGHLSCELVRRWDTDAAAVCLVVVAGHATAMLTQPWAGRLGPAVNGHAEQADATGLHDPVMFAAQALIGGVREEIPLLALPAALMAAARRPGWQILIVVCALRVAPHAYLGTAALGAAVFAAISWWMYRASGRIGPIIIGHTLYNATTVLGGAIGHAVLLATPALAVIALANAPRIAPKWARKKPRTADRPVNAKGPVL